MFSTHAVVFSPYNYHWYRPTTARKLWVFLFIQNDEIPPQIPIWRGKNHKYMLPWYTRWWKSYEIGSTLRRKWVDDDHEWQEKTLAFAQGSHPRLGAESLVSRLDPLMLQRMTQARPYNG